MSVSKLREAINAGETLLAPGVYDMVSAAIAEKIGFSALFVGGYGISASHLGLPDVGIMTFTDILDRVRTISSNVNQPVIVDADNDDVVVVVFRCNGAFVARSAITEMMTFYYLSFFKYTYGAVYGSQANPWIFLGGSPVNFLGIWVIIAFRNYPSDELTRSRNFKPF